jgi:hypothetical protein
MQCFIYPHNQPFSLFYDFFAKKLVNLVKIGPETGKIGQIFMVFAAMRAARLLKGQ